VNAIETVPVKGLRQFLIFSKVPRLLYSGSQGFAPMLDAERWTLYGKALNPHFKSVDSQSWLAYKNGRIAGRIFAQIYKNHIVPLGASLAQFGCLDSIDDEAVLDVLVSVAEDWLRDRGAILIHGPFSPSIWSEVGMLVEGFKSVPMILIPWHPPYLPAMLERRGYRKARDLISYRYDLTPEDQIAKAGIIDRPEWRDRLKIRNIDLGAIAKEAEILVDIFNDGWRENWGFVPFTYDEFMATAESLKFVMPRDGGFIVELDNVPQAFGVVLPNLHEVSGDLRGRLFPFGLPKLIFRLRRHSYKSGRLALFGIRSALHRKAVGGVVILAFIEEMRRRSRNYDVEHVEFGWVLEDNMGMRRPIELSGAKVDKVHRVYEKNLIPFA
jgi:hypothetical protein